MTPENERERDAADVSADATEKGGRVDTDGATHDAAGDESVASAGASASPGGTDDATRTAAEAGAAGADAAGERAAAPNGAADGGDGADLPNDVDGGGGVSAEGDVTTEEPSLEARLLASEALAAAHWDRLVRLQAEMENQRKRAQRDVGNARKFALEGIAQDLLPLKDSLELGLRAAADEGASPKSLVEGSELTLKMFSQMLEKHGIVEIDPAGEKFDPEFHQAMSMQEVEGVAPNTVTGVMQKGYTLNERLVRPALVMVSK